MKDKLTFIGTLIAPWIGFPFLLLCVYALMVGFNSWMTAPGLGKDEVRVLYLYDVATDTGQRICETGFDFREPECVYVLRDEWASKKGRMKWAVIRNMPDGFNEFVRYDGWYVERGERKRDVIRLYKAISANPSVEVSPLLYLWAFQADGEGDWEDVDWDEFYELFFYLAESAGYI